MRLWRMRLKRWRPKSGHRITSGPSLPCGGVALLVSPVVKCRTLLRCQQMVDDLAKFGPAVVTAVTGTALSLWSRHRTKIEKAEEDARAKVEAKASADAAEALQARRAAVDARIVEAMTKAREAHDRIDRERQEWLDGHHRVRSSVTDGLVEAYERLRLVEQELAVIKDRTHRNGDNK